MKKTEAFNLETRPDWFRYFFLMGEPERRLVETWYKNQDVKKTEKQKEFFEIVGTAIKHVDYDYRIAVIEPSNRGNGGEIYYSKGTPAYRRISCYNWYKKARDFAPKYGSALADIYELFLWYAYRIAKGYWTIEYVCDDSSSEGNYWDSPQSSHNFENSGIRKVGGFYDGIGNLYKVVINPKGGFILNGGCYKNIGKDVTVSRIFYNFHSDYITAYCTGCLVLKGENIK